MNKKLASLTLAVLSTIFTVGAAQAACTDVSRTAFVNAANTAALETGSYGFGLPMWATMVNETGAVCHVYSTNNGVANTGALAGNSAWLGSRVISAQKANTANAFSLNGLAISTGAIYAPVQPGGSLFGLQESNPVNAAAAYRGAAANFGTALDPMVGQRIGGVNVFGGGLPLYKTGNIKIGGLGASGDSSCRDHVFAWRMRVALANDFTPNSDALKFVTLAPAALFESPECAVSPASTTLMTTTNLTYGIQ